jgi:hypothetical protein
VPHIERARPGSITTITTQHRAWRPGLRRKEINEH